MLFIFDIRYLSPGEDFQAACDEKSKGPALLGQNKIALNGLSPLEGKGTEVTSPVQYKTMSPSH